MSSSWLSLRLAVEVRRRLGGDRVGLFEMELAESFSWIFMCLKTDNRVCFKTALYAFTNKETSQMILLFVKRLGTTGLMVREGRSFLGRSCILRTFTDASHLFDG